ncbi:hypothetical protein HMPREF3204_00628 [Gardnerella pickettii]|nr:hypothetical protein HMPREF3204_00628 [Gardnerella pickettii]
MPCSAFVSKNTKIQYNRTTVLCVCVVCLRNDLPERLKRSARRQLGALSRSNVKPSGLYVRRRRSRS